MSEAPRRTTSQLRFAAVNRALEHLHRGLVATLEKHAEANRLRIDAWAYMPATELPTIANYAAGHAQSAVSLAHALGRAEGRAEMRAELGLPPENVAGPADDTTKLAACPVDGRLCPVPANRRKASDAV
jgi:hypothetical protein